MTGPKLHIKSFGCQMNKLDSSLVVSALKEGGFEMTDKATEADVVLINTCSVRGHAEDRVISNLGHLQHLKKSRPEIVVAVMGCMAQRLGEELLAHPAVDIVAGPAQIPQIPAMINDALSRKTQPASGEKKTDPAGGKAIAITEKIRDRHAPDENKTLDDFELAYDSDDNHISRQAFVRVMRGCNNFCTYCIVPYVRGPEISRPPKAIIEQIRKLADKGVEQITLLGQTIDAYKYEAGDKTYGLSDLLEMTSEIEAVKWVRFITSHPGKFDPAILKAMGSLPKVCSYLHIPAQSGSDRILKAMNRGYTSGQYLDLIAQARDIVPGVSIVSDFIVGFPNETDEDFAATVDLVEKARFKNSFVFKYSPRPGTHATKKMEDNVTDEVKKERNIALLDVQNRISEEDNKQLMGQTLEVLVEGLSKKSHLNKAENDNNPQLIGRTATDYIVVFNGPETLSGGFAKVKIDKTSALTLFGQLA